MKLLSKTTRWFLDTFTSKYYTIVTRYSKDFKFLGSDEVIEHRRFRWSITFKINDHRGKRPQPGISGLHLGDGWGMSGL